MPLFLMHPKQLKIIKLTTRENFDPQNTHEKKSWSHKIPTKKNLGHAKYPGENILDPQNTHEGTMTRQH